MVSDGVGRYNYLAQRNVKFDVLDGVEDVCMGDPYWW